jgi:hypothetical protein
LDEGDAVAFLKDTASLLNALSRAPEGMAAHHLTSAPDEYLLDQINWLFKADNESAPAPLSYEHVCSVLTLDDFPADVSRLTKALTWDAASAVTLGRAPLAMLIIETDASVCFPGEAGLPNRFFWWAAGLPHDASAEEKKARHRECLLTLEAND